MAEGFEPSHGRINSAVPYQLGYATRKFGGCGWTRTTTLALMRRLLSPFELHSHVDLLETRGGVEPRAIRPALRFGFEDRCRERGPLLEAMVRFELTHFCLQDSCSTGWSYIAANSWTGREADAPLPTPRSQTVKRSAGMSHAPIIIQRRAFPQKSSHSHRASTR